MSRLPVSLVMILLGLACFLSACFPKYRYDRMNVALNRAGSGSVAIAVLDQRPYVRSGEKDPSFVGIMRGGYGNPFSLYTSTK